MSDRARPLHPYLAGALSGVGLADVLLGLNPHLLDPLASARLVAGLALLGALVALPLALALSRPPGRLFWSTLAAGAIAFAFLAEAQRTLFYPSLGNGARRVLVAATLVAILVGLAALGAALRPPCGTTAPRLLAVLLALGALAPAVGRRAPERQGLATPAALAGTTTRSLVVVGIEGASWDVVAAGASDGSLPVLARLLKEGTGGPLGSLAPYDRDALFTSAATGKSPVKHGVVSGWEWATPLGTLRLLPRLPGASSFGFGSRRATRGEGRRSLTFWEILSARGHEAVVLGWPAVEPARDGLVLWATERLFDGDSSPDAARPADTAARARLFRVAPLNLDRPLVTALIGPGLSPEDRARARPLAGAARDLSIVGATLGATPAGPGSVTAMVLTGLDSVSRAFGPAAAPNRYWGLTPRSVEARAATLRAYYRFLDDALGELLAREGDRTVCVFAPVGYGPPPPLTAFATFARGLDPSASPEAAGEGFVIFHGSGIRAGMRLTSAEVLDLAPTLLVLAGEPMARDMDGRVLSEVLDERFAVSTSIPIVTTFEPDGPQ